MVQAIDWGDVPTWVSAVTTSGAFVAAAVVVRIEMRRDRRSVAQREREEQADRVAAWYDDADDDGRIVLRNGSNLPIFNVVLEVFSDRPGVRCPPLRSAPPGNTHIDFPTGVLGPYERMAFRLFFTDAAGRTWMRWTDGKLGRLSAESLEWYRDEVASMFNDQRELRPGDD